jgi:Ser/Thr protein kinase RdoA (MazF antagonist)
VRVAASNTKAFAEVMRGIGIRDAEPRRLRARSQLWLVEHPIGPVVVKRHTVQRPADEPQALSNVEWVHEFLQRLETVGVPAPRAAPIFGGGNSCAAIAGSIWEAVTYRAGVIIGWSRRPALREVGQFLAEFHAAASAVTGAGQRPVCIPIETLGAVAASVGPTF